VQQAHLDDENTENAVDGYAANKRRGGGDAW